MQLVELLGRRPKGSLWQSPEELGSDDLITTDRTPESDDDVNGVELRTTRALDILPNGEDQLGGNELSVAGSVPTGFGRRNMISMRMKFTQYSTLASGSFTVDALLTELKQQRERRIRFSSISVALNWTGEEYASAGPKASSDFIRFDDATGRLVKDNGAGPSKATAAQISRMMMTGRQVMAQLVKEEDADAKVQDGLTGAFLSRVGACTAPCAATGQLRIRHPAWGEMTVVTTVLQARVDGSPNSAIVAVDAAGNVRWRHDTGTERSFVPARPAVDKVGNIFVVYNPGRYDGVIVLRPVTAGFEDFKSLPSPDEYGPRFYGARVADVDRDGIFEILTTVYGCDPSCVDGQVQKRTYGWNGRDYVVRTQR